MDREPLETPLGVEGFTYAKATDADWDWALDAQVATAWQTIPPDLREQVDRDQLRDRLIQQRDKLRNERASTLFIARSGDGTPAGAVWVCEMPDLFTGWVRAYVLDLFVADAFRRKGLGRALMRAAEGWGRRRGLKRAALFVASHNAPAVALYEAMGYRSLGMRMDKPIGPAN